MRGSLAGVPEPRPLLIVSRNVPSAWQLATARRIPTATWRRKPAVPKGTPRTGGRAPENAKLPKAVIFDLDGTLLDSVDLHALAWHEAMLTFGHDVSFAQARS